MTHKVDAEFLELAEVVAELQLLLLVQVLLALLDLDGRVALLLDGCPPEDDGGEDAVLSAENPQGTLSLLPFFHSQNDAFSSGHVSEVLRESYSH